MSILSVRNGERCILKDIQGGIGIRNKLKAMGIIPGIEITRVSNQILKGPIIIRVGQTQLAIGHGMASKMIVKRIMEGR